jgi:hypothetical protein
MKKLYETKRDKEFSKEDCVARIDSSRFFFNQRIEKTGGR